MWTFLQQEELTHSLLKTLRKPHIEKAQCESWKHFRETCPTAKSDNSQIMKVFAELYTYAMDATDQVGIRPMILPLVDEAKSKDVRRAYKQFVLDHPAMDAMDALHITVGHELGCTGFVSFDHGWQTVSTIDGYAYELDGCPVFLGDPAVANT